MRLADALPWFATVVRREPPTTIGTTVGLVQQRPLVIEHDAEFLDPPRSSNIPHRASRMPVTFWQRDYGIWSEPMFVAETIDALHPQAATPYGSFLPDHDRVNRHVPSHIAYGTLFQD